MGNQAWITVPPLDVCIGNVALIALLKIHLKPEDVGLGLVFFFNALKRSEEGLGFEKPSDNLALKMFR